MSSGQSHTGIVNPKLVDKLISSVNLDAACVPEGWYEIIWDSKKLCPIGLERLPHDVEVEKRDDGMYRITHINKPSVNPKVEIRGLYASQVIYFSRQEFRERKLSKLLK